MLEQPHEIRGQAGAIGAVGHAVVEGERQRQDEPRDDAPAADHGFLPSHAEYEYAAAGGDEMRE